MNEVLNQTITDSDRRPTYDGGSADGGIAGAGKLSPVDEHGDDDDSDLPAQGRSLPPALMPRSGAGTANWAKLRTHTHNLIQQSKAEAGVLDGNTPRGGQTTMSSPREKGLSTIVMELGMLAPGRVFGNGVRELTRTRRSDSAIAETHVVLLVLSRAELQVVSNSNLQLFK